MLCNYECLCLNQYFKTELKNYENYENYKRTVELINENQNDISQIPFEFANHYPSGSKIVEFIKW